MNRLRATNSVVFASRDTAPVSGTPQYATDGNPATSTPATQWPAYAWNMIQDELCNLITAMGGTLDDTNWSQLAQYLLLGRVLSSTGPTLITATGAYNYVPSATMKLVRFRCQASGGGGGGAVATSGSQVSMGGHGGGGAFLDLWMTAAQVTGLLTSGHLVFTLGAAAGAATGAAGTDGGDFTISGNAGVFATIKGGKGGPSSGVLATASLPAAGPGGAQTATPTSTSGLVAKARVGKEGGVLYYPSATVTLSTGGGGESEYGPGASANFVQNGSPGITSPSYGGGGGATMAGVSQSNLTGGVGGGPLLEFLEYG
jgi:hypothetical protein